LTSAANLQFQWQTQNIAANLTAQRQTQILAASCSSGPVVATHAFAVDLKMLGQVHHARLGQWRLEVSSRQQATA